MDWNNSAKQYILDFNPNDVENKYTEYLKNTKIMSGAGVIQLLNKILSFAPTNTCYIEIGVHRGCTLIGASLDNHHMCIAVDNFKGHNSPQDIAPFRSVKEGLAASILKYKREDKIVLFEEDYILFLTNRAEMIKQTYGPCSVYMYDGNHEAIDQLLGVLMSSPILDKNAFVFIDDTHGGQDEFAVQLAIQTIIGRDKRFSLVRDFVNDKPNDRNGMWNGLAVLEFNK